MNSWVETWGPLVTLMSTVALAVVTGWLAYVTMAMANTAKEAAEQSRIAAESSLAAVAAAEAAVDVRFDLEPLRTSTAGEMLQAAELLQLGGLKSDDEVPDEFFSRILAWRAVRLTCRGATVNVHAVKVTSVTIQDRSDQDSRIQKSTTSVRDIELAGSDELPRLCHVDEVLEFDVVGRPPGEKLVEVIGAVSYSFGAGAIRQREVKWTRSADRKRSNSGPSAGRDALDKNATP